MLQWLMKSNQTHLESQIHAFFRAAVVKCETNSELLKDLTSRSQELSSKVAFLLAQ